MNFGLRIQIFSLFLAKPVTNRKYFETKNKRLDIKDEPFGKRFAAGFRKRFFKFYPEKSLKE
jgi:hypothetical protein